MLQLHPHALKRLHDIKAAIDVPAAAPDVFSFRYSFDERFGDCIKDHGSIEVREEKPAASALRWHALTGQRPARAATAAAPGGEKRGGGKEETERSRGEDTIAAKFTALAGVIRNADADRPSVARAEEPQAGNAGASEAYAGGGGEGTRRRSSSAGWESARDAGREKIKHGPRDDRPAWGRGAPRTEAPRSARPAQRDRVGDASRRRSASAGRSRASEELGVAREKETEGKKRRSVGGDSSFRYDLALEDSSIKSTGGDSSRAANISSGSSRMHERLTLSSISKMTPRRRVSSPAMHVDQLS